MPKTQNPPSSVVGGAEFSLNKCVHPSAIARALAVTGLCGTHSPKANAIYGYATKHIMLNLLHKVRDVMRTTREPNPQRRAEVVRFLAQRPSRTHEEWRREFAAAWGIPLGFVAWYRDTCSKYFEFDLSAALPGDRMKEDLGFSDATWSDADLDILEDFEAEFDCRPPTLERFTTYGQFLEALWLHAHANAVA